MSFRSRSSEATFALFSIIINKKGNKEEAEEIEERMEETSEDIPVVVVCSWSSRLFLACKMSASSSEIFVAAERASSLSVYLYIKN